MAEKSTEELGKQGVQIKIFCERLIKDFFFGKPRQHYQKQTGWTENGSSKMSVCIFW